MKWLRTVATELFGLFVDDGRLAILALAWMVVAALLLSNLPAGSLWPGLILFAGLALILIDSVTRTTQSVRKTPR
jgi:hypothetical protein